MDCNSPYSNSNVFGLFRNKKDTIFNPSFVPFTYVGLYATNSHLFGAADVQKQFVDDVVSAT